MGDLLRFDPIARRVGLEPAETRIKALLEADDPRARVREMDPYALYCLVREVGSRDALDLIHLASGEQAQAFVDFSCWTADRAALDRFAAWLALFLGGPDEGPTEVVSCIDPELLGLFIQQNVRLYLWEDEEESKVLDQVEGRIASSPDGVFAIVMPEDEERAALIDLTLRRLYDRSVDEARQLLMAVRAELTSRLEETAYQMRSARIQQWGFLPREEAVEVYAHVDPARERSRASEALAAEEPPTVEVRTEGTVQLPLPIGRELVNATSEEGSFFGRALRRTTDASDSLKVADGLLVQLGGLVNRAIAADSGDPGEISQLADAFRYAHGWLNIGLEYLSARDLDDAARLLRLWSLKRVFSVGNNLAAALVGQARQLVERRTLTLVEELPTSLCNASERELVEGLLQPRPLRSRADGTPFESLEDIAEAANTLSLLAYKAMWTFGPRGWTRRDLAALVVGPPGTVTAVEDVSFDALLATRAATALLDPGSPLRPLTRDELARSIDEQVSSDGVSPPLATSLASVAQMPQAGVDSGAQRLAQRWVEAVSAELAEGYGALDGQAAADPHLLPNLLLVARG